MRICGAGHVDKDYIKAYAKDLEKLLAGVEIVRNKAFLRSFIEKIMIGEKVRTICYGLPLPAEWRPGRIRSSANWTIWWSWGINR